MRTPTGTLATLPLATRATRDSRALLGARSLRRAGLLGALCVVVVGALVVMGCSSSGTEGGDGPQGTTSLVVNEIVATGSNEWLELMNVGSAELDVGNYAVTDTDKDTNGPKLTTAMRFPAGTKIAPGAFVLVALSRSETVVGPYPKEGCAPGAQVGCYYARFGLSATSGETAYVLKPDNSIVGSTAYPKALPVPSAANKSACRVPDGTGELVVCSATPGGPNAK